MLNTTNKTEHMSEANNNVANAIKQSKLYRYLSDSGLYSAKDYTKSDMENIINFYNEHNGIVVEYQAHDKEGVLQTVPVSGLIKDRVDAFFHTHERVIKNIIDLNTFLENYPNNNVGKILKDAYLKVDKKLKLRLKEYLDRIIETLRKAHKYTDTWVISTLSEKEEIYALSDDLSTIASEYIHNINDDDNMAYNVGRYRVNENNLFILSNEPTYHRHMWFIEIVKHYTVKYKCNGYLFNTSLSRWVKMYILLVSEYYSYRKEYRNCSKDFYIDACNALFKSIPNTGHDLSAFRFFFNKYFSNDSKYTLADLKSGRINLDQLLEHLSDYINNSVYYDFASTQYTEEFI